MENSFKLVNEGTLFMSGWRSAIVNYWDLIVPKKIFRNVLIGKKMNLDFCWFQLSNFLAFGFYENDRDKSQALAKV